MQTLLETSHPVDTSRQFPLPANLLIRIIWAVLLGVAATALPLILAGKWFPSALLMATEVVLFFGLMAARRKRAKLASWLVLMPLTGCVAILIVVGKGPVDEAVLTLPGLMIFASLFGNRRVYLTLLVFVALLLGAMGAAHFLGWWVLPLTKVRPDTFTTVFVILAITSYFVWVMARALHSTLVRLEIENKRVRNSLARIEVLAHHDSLTGLPNRALARDRFEHSAATAKRTQEGAALLYLDLDDFKAVNDSLGHAAGDALLRDVAARLAACVRSNDTVSRQGGDEFLIVLDGLATEDGAGAIAHKLVQELARPFSLNGLEITVTGSLGIALYPANGGDFETLLKNADLAMYQAKEAGRNAFHFFDEKMNANVAEHLHLVSAMRSALANNEFRLHYQPQFALADERIVGAEALIRWTHPELGPMAPAHFIPLAERSGLIFEIGAWVLQEACRQAKAWQLAGLNDLVIAVNVSPVQLRRDNLAGEVQKALLAADLAPRCISLELTESMLLADSQALRDTLDRIRALGLRISIDDFGTGYSSLSYLKRFDVERLKIDQSFVRRMTQDTNDEGIVRAIIQIASSLHLEAVAEGVEDRQTMARLAQMGCGYGQGYLWSPALPPEEFFRFVKDRA